MAGPAPAPPPPIPEGWVWSPTRTPGGDLYSPPGADRPHIRIMPPGARYPDGYWRHMNEDGNYLDVDGNVSDDDEKTHIPLPPMEA